VDAEVAELLSGLSAISLDGAKGVGKTSTALHHGASIVALDDPAVREVLEAQPRRLTLGDEPIVIDEWQRLPASWDVVRRAVDADPRPGRFILTGSASPTNRPTHSGAGRIVPVRMRPLSLAERGLEQATVSLATLLTGRRPELDGTTDVDLEGYTDEILMGGFPGMRHRSARLQRAALDGYLRVIIDRDLPEVGLEVRNPAGLDRWLRAYAAATSTAASYETIRDAATGGQGEKPAKTTTIPYRDALERLWLLDPLPAWAPTKNHLSRLAIAPKHHLADPALAARLVGLDAGALLSGEGPDVIRRGGSFLGALFESLMTLSIRVAAQASEATVHHLRSHGGHREIDLVVVRPDQRVVAIEVKLSREVADADVRHLDWLRGALGDDLLDAVVVTTGGHAYRRADGIGVVPAALLGP
jgi:predicted AAA+ superfamily ATPase